MDISVVIPVYNEEGALPAVYRALTQALDRPPQSATDRDLGMSDNF